MRPNKVWGAFFTQSRKKEVRFYAEWIFFAPFTGCKTGDLREGAGENRRRRESAAGGKFADFHLGVPGLQTLILFDAATGAILFEISWRSEIICLILLYK